MKEALLLIYKKVEAYLYGSVSIVTDRDGPVVPVEWSSPFVIYKEIDGRKKFFGSIYEQIGKINELLGSLRAVKTGLKEKLDRQGINYSRKRKGTNREIITIAPDELTEKLLNDFESEMEKCILLTSLYSRILFEMFPCIGKDEIKFYNDSGQIAGEIQLRKITDLLAHHRYLFVDTEYIKDLFSDRQAISADHSLGYQVSHYEFADAIEKAIKRIRINDLVCLLAERFGKLSMMSKYDDVVFLIQNIESLSDILGKKIADPRYPEMLELMANKPQKQFLEKMQKQGVTPKRLELVFQEPAFKIFEDLSKKTNRNILANGIYRRYPRTIPIPRNTTYSHRL